MRQAIQQLKGLSQPELPPVASLEQPDSVSARDAEPASSRDAANDEDLDVSKTLKSQTHPSKSELWHRVRSWAIPPLSQSTGTPSVQQQHTHGAPVDQSQSAQLASQLAAKNLLELGRIPEECHTSWDEHCSDLQPLSKALDAGVQANITPHPDWDGERDPLILRVELKVAARKLVSPVVEH